MNLVTRCLALLGMLGLAHARPVFVDNVSIISNPNPAVWEFFPASVALDTNFALVGAEYWDRSTVPSQLHQTAFLYQRSGGGWTLVRQLEETVVPCCGPRNSLNVAMGNGIAAVNTTPMKIYEQGPGGWLLAPSAIPVTGAFFDLEIDNGRIINNEGACSWDAGIVEKASDGVWRKVATLPGAFRGCEYASSGSVDISGSSAVVLQESGTEVPDGEQQAWIFRRGASGWSRQGIAHLPLLSEQRGYTLYTHAAIRGPDVFMGSGLVNGVLVFRDVPGQGLQVADRLRPADGSMGGNDTAQLKKHGDYLLQKTMLFDRDNQPSVLNVWRRRADAGYEHVAALVHRGNAEWPGPVYEQSTSNVAIHNGTVLATDAYNRVVYHWELPGTTAPAPRQETFNVGLATNWTTSAGSQFTVLRGDRSRVLRQSQTAIDTRALYEPADWTNQAIEVDVKAAQFANDTAAISLITRWQGPDNFYEFVYGPQRFEFRRMASGTLRTLYSVPGPWLNFMQPGRNYRLRLESIGTRHQFFIDGGVVASPIFSTGMTHGRVGVGTYRASADFDNVQITPSPLASIYRNYFHISGQVPWTRSGEGNWAFEDGYNSDVRLVQYSTAGEGRVTIGSSTAEQRVEAVARVMQFAPATGTQRRWFGVVARYVDADNHYILALRNSNALVLSRRVNGIDTTLGNFAVNVIPQHYYTIRLDAIGSQLRAYLNERLLFEVSDTAHPTGSTGMTTFKTYAEFDRFVAYQP